MHRTSDLKDILNETNQNINMLYVGTAVGCDSSAVMQC